MCVFLPISDLMIMLFNLLYKYNEQKYEKMNIKSVYSLEKLKKNLTKYKKEMKKKASMNMISIVSSYINNNIKPEIFVLGTKI